MKHRLCVNIDSFCRASFFKQMKISFILVCLFALFFTVGCAQVVVYRINPDAPPKMKLKEARDAVELSLTLRNLNPEIENVSLDIDGLSTRVSPGGRAFVRTVGYADIDWEIVKEGKDYVVPIGITTGSQYFPYRYSMLIWKSEEDAKLFLDAFYALRQFKIRGSKDTDVVATASAPPLKKVVPPQELVQKEKAPQIKSPGPDLAQLKPAPSTSPPQATPEPPKPAVSKNVPPKITITEPDLTRAVSVVAKKMDTLVTGIAESKAGIMYVSVNGQDADLDDKGNFSAVVPLKVGQNTVTVIAADINKNKSTKEFVVNREAGKVILAKKEEDKMTGKLSNSKYYALLVAVQNYDSPEISKLDYPVSDAKKLEDLLSSQYTFDRENITTLVNPTRRTIYQTLQSLRNKLTDKDNLLIFYAGHGFWVEDMKQGFWLATDATGINDPSDWIPNSTVRDYIKAIKARHILLVADSCFSGAIFKTREFLVKQKAYVDQIYELPSRRAMTSGAMKTVPDQSVFLYYLVKRLKDNKEPYLDTQKLFANMREAVINNSPTHQTPLYGAISEAGDEGGDFIFVRR